MKLAEWYAHVRNSRDLYFYEAAEAQRSQWEQLEADLGAPVEVSGHHTSKSAQLPVIKVLLPSLGVAYVRDNFYNVVLGLNLEKECPLTAEQTGRLLSWSEYVDNIQRCRNYTYRGWSDSEMADPLIVSVYVRREDGGSHISSVKAETKWRWVNRMESPEWYVHDWSGGRIMAQGPMPGCDFWHFDQVWGEGMPDSVCRNIWVPGEKQGLIGGNFEKIRGLIRILKEASSSTKQD